jgi:hypothetical protein
MKPLHCQSRLTKLLSLAAFRFDLSLIAAYFHPKTGVISKILGELNH